MVTGVGVAVTPVSLVTELIAAAIAIPLSCVKLLADCVLLTVSVVDVVPGTGKPLITKSFEPISFATVF